MLESPTDVLIQIYEIQNREEAEILVSMGVDHIGSVLTTADAPIDDELLETIRFVSQTDSKSSLIPLFQDVDQISRVLDKYRPGIVHFCESLAGGDEDRIRMAALERQQAVRERFPEIQIMRSVPIGRNGHADGAWSLGIAKLFEPASDFFLTDTLLETGSVEGDDAQPVAGFVGITGETCDWRVAQALVRESRIPVILAGGISPGNVSDGIRTVAPAGVDSCTLTNAMDPLGKPIRFRKDMEKVKQLVDNVRHNQIKN